MSTLSAVATQLAVAIAVVGMFLPDALAAETTDLTAQPIAISGDIAHRWETPQGGFVALVRGHARVQQGELVCTAQQMVVWESPAPQHTQVDVYLEGDVRMAGPGRTRNQSELLTRLSTTSGVTWQARWPRDYDRPVSDPLLDRALARRTPEVQSTPPVTIQQTQAIEVPAPDIDYATVVLDQPDTPLRRIRVYARTGQPFSFKTELSEETTPPQQVGILTGGIKLNVDSPQPGGVPDPDAIELAADNMVLWTDAAELNRLSVAGEGVQTRDKPLQIYLEGNIVIRKNQEILRADRAYYDAREERALLLDAELKIYIPQAQNYLRVRANRIRQMTGGAFHAQQAWMSASYFGKPGYRLEAESIFLEPRIINPWVHAQGGHVDPVTGKVDDGEVDWLTTVNNRFVIGDVPVFYTPYLSGPAEDPNIPIQRAEVRTDNIFGTQIRTAWDPFHLFLRDTPEGLSASVLLDYYSARGPGGGLEAAFNGTDMFGAGDKYKGEALGYYINDSDVDNLGRDRRRLIPADENRGRVRLRHRHDFPYDLMLFAEIGYVSDRNFLEQYYENEFDTGEDNQTRLTIEQDIENLTWSLTGRPQTNGFENTTEWYPKGDLFVLGEPLLDSPITWTSHSSAGYGHLNRADLPTDPRDVFTPINYYSGAQGGVFMSRHELTAPFTLGPVVLAPFVMGEGAFWEEDLTNSQLDRFVGSAGVRGSLSMWRVFPHVSSRIFNLNGLAHRMVFDFEYRYTDSTQDYTRIAQYNDFEDDSQERFRQRFITNTFAGNQAGFLEARRYAIRTGAGNLVSVPWHELVDDLQVLTFGWRHRLQTKVGPPEDQRIRDWMTLDLEASFFPRAGHQSPAGQDFSEDFGLLSGRYAWLFSDRTTLLASALYDTFDGGQEVWNLGLLSQRSGRGSVYGGLRQIKARGIDSTIATGTASYLLSEKWAGSVSTAYDLKEGQSRGQSLTMTRLGADFIFHFGFSFNQSKDNVGVAIALEPRFGPRTPYSAQMDHLFGIDQ